MEYFDLTPTLPRPKSLSNLFRGKTRSTLRRSFGSTFPGIGKIGLNIRAADHELVNTLESAELWDYGRVSVARRDIVRDELQPFAPLIARKHFVPFHADMIPTTSFGASLANLLTPVSWKAVRKPFFQAAGYVCQICGEADGAVEGHEVWQFFDGRGERNGWALQRLETILCLCRGCHQMFHLGLGAINGQSKKIGERIRSINEWTAGEYRSYFDNAKRQHAARSRRNWTLDLSAVAGPLRLDLKSIWTRTSSQTLSAKTATGNTETRLVGANYRLDGSFYFEPSSLNIGAVR
ncbi:hypothetical protein [Rhizobium sp. MHM7A]|uniref:hypothetical protein n=1 Tax=Rhizobium sp. MHM7A TaxID=2583233 RepID=UPI00110579D4|nr:hypothetical protein [Rhizobium sp. MHM7A]TLX16271.1 hypothetical protein FFR93_02785 [Rhizobium sp. MHM7A]